MSCLPPKHVHISRAVRRASGRGGGRRKGLRGAAHGSPRGVRRGCDAGRSGQHVRGQHGRRTGRGGRRPNFSLPTLPSFFPVICARVARACGGLPRVVRVHVAGRHAHDARVWWVVTVRTRRAARCGLRLACGAHAGARCEHPVGHLKRAREYNRGARACGGSPRCVRLPHRVSAVRAVHARGAAHAA